MPRLTKGAVPRAMTAAVEYGVSRAGLGAARVLDRDVIGQAHHPRGAAGRVTAWEMAHRPSNRQRSRWVVSLLDIQPADRVLELGFGPGVAIAAVARAGAAHVYGVDHSGVMARQASKRNAAAIRAGRVTLITASADQLPATLDGPFDAILAVNSLGFWPVPGQRLADLRRRLAPGGRIAIASQPRCPGATADTSDRAAREIEALLTETGFTHLSTHTLALSPPAACVLGRS
ncbi:MAG TPA: methyltransferase domain-containing protein [Streptosporangiaceae bacterium]